MPGTTRYSATFDRPYEEEEGPPAEAPAQRRSRSQSWQAPSLSNGRQYSPFGHNSVRSSSTDNGTKGVELIPTRTVGKAAVKAHNNPFQFVKVGTCPLYKKAEEQLKKVKEVKKPDVLKEEEEEWQSNLDSWKSRRRKMSEDVFRRQEEIRQLELEEQFSQLSQKKTKTFSEMVESRAFRGRTLSLCLISSPLDFQDWDSENNSFNNRKNSHSSDGSEENSTVNSEDENDNCPETQKKFSKSTQDIHNNSNTETAINNLQTISQTDTQNSDSNNLDNSQEPINQKEGNYIDSGLESISSSQRAGDIADSGSDFSQDSASSMDSGSPRVSALTLNTIHLYEDYATKSLQMNGVEPDLNSSCKEISLKLVLNDKFKDYGLTFNSCKKDKESIISASVLEGSIAKSCGVLNGDHILSINGKDVSTMNHSQINSLLKIATEQKHLNLMLKRPESGKEDHTLHNGSCSSLSENILPKEESNKSVKSSSIKSTLKTTKQTKSDNVNKITKSIVKNGLKQEKSIESENEMFVDDFEELNKASTLANSSKTSDISEKIKSPEKISPNISSSSASSLCNTEYNATSTKTKNIPESIKENENTNVKIPTSQNTVQSPKKTIKVTKKKQSTNNQNVNKKSIQKEAVKVYNDPSLNIVFHSKSTTISENHSDKSKSESNLNSSHSSSLKTDVPSVDKVAEEMEKLILQQLEEEERAKEMLNSKSIVTSSETLFTAPPRQVEPPKEKPPPPPKIMNDVQKPCSLKRVNSTKRIKKEINKRRSNFLGIENDDENAICDDTIVPPPPALKEILKAEMELDRESRRQLENAAVQRISLEESELIKKEKEIIENLENEERQKLINNFNVDSNKPADKSFENCEMKEEERIKSLKEEKKKNQEEQILNDEQQIRIAEEKKLKEREDFIKKQEDTKSKTVQPSDSISVAENSTNNSAKPLLVSSLSPGTKSNTMLSENNKGGGKNNAISLSSSLLTKENGNNEKLSAPIKPGISPKPLKKKEVLRKERERLRQEQEALQREREAHRQKLLQEQEEKKNHSKSHAPVSSRLGPLPFKPAFSPQLTAPSSSPIARENASVTNRSHHGAQNGIPGITDSVEATHISSQSSNRQNGRSAVSQGKSFQNESWTQQKVPPVKKQNQDTPSESRYNQNHWLIQEAEMRRITEFKERQRAAQTNSYSHAHLAEDDVCSASSKIINHSQGPIYAVPNRQWACKQTDQPIKKYPPLRSSEKSYQTAPQPPNKPSRVVPMERPEQMLSVSGRKRCSHCNEELGRGAAMIIESLQLYYHIQCFQCCVCQAQLGNGSCGTDVRVRNNKLHCQNCYSNDEAGLKFSQV